MNGALGMAGIALGLAASVLGGVTLVIGLAKHRLRLVRSGTVYVWLVLAGAVLAVIAMERALITRDFSLSYVAEVGSSRTPALYNVASLWSSLDGLDPALDDHPGALPGRHAAVVPPSPVRPAGRRGRSSCCSPSRPSSSCSSPGRPTRSGR